MKIINNITDKLSDELKEKLEPGSKLSIAAACFSVYAFEELKTQLEGKPNIGGLFLLRKPCSHKLSFLRPCYAIGAFFGCFSRLLTWGK